MKPITLFALALLGIVFTPTVNSFARLPAALFLTPKQKEDSSSSVPSKNLFPSTRRRTRPATALPVSSITSVISNVTSGALVAVPSISKELLTRSSFCAISTLTTWATVQHLGMTIVQASALQGLLGCLLLPKPYALAFLCGSFAGMSAHPGTAIGEAGLLAVACTGMFYWFEDKKLAVGKGGRLGLIAFLSNIMYYMIRKGPALLLSNVLHQVGGPATAVGMGLAGLLLWAVRNTAKRSPIKTGPAQKQKLALLGIQSIMFGLFWKRLVTLGVPIAGMATTLAATFVSSLLVWKSPYTATTVAGLGVLSGFVSPAMSPAMYMGTFIGMCSLPGFRTAKFLLASTLSATLFELGILGGFGGRLGFLAYLGVSFAL